MPTTLTQHYSPACWRCGLRFANQPLLELHIREDHLEPRRRHAEPDRDDCGDARTPRLAACIGSAAWRPGSPAPRMR
jgi:hypothetical protein